MKEAKKPDLGDQRRQPRRYWIAPFQYTESENKEIRNIITTKILSGVTIDAPQIDEIVANLEQIVGVIKYTHDNPVQFSARLNAVEFKRINSYYKKLSDSLLAINEDDLSILRSYYQNAYVHEQNSKKYNVHLSACVESGIADLISGALENIENVLQLIAPAAYFPKGNRPFNDILYYAVTGIYLIYQKHTRKPPTEGGALQELISAALIPFYNDEKGNFPEAIRDSIQRLKKNFKS